MKLTSRTLALALATTAVAAGAYCGTASASTTVVTQHRISVYQGKIINQNIVLGPQSAPTTLVTTPWLPAGTYMVTAIVGAVIAGNDQIVCAVSNNPPSNDSVFGSASNGPGAFMYATATITDTWTIPAGGGHLTLGCNSFNFGKGTLVGDAVLNAVPVSDLHTN